MEILRSSVSEVMHKIIKQMNAGAPYVEILDFVFEALKVSIPYDRMAVALLSDDQCQLKAHWVRSSKAPRHLKRDYAAPVSESLREILTTGKARLIDDLQEYLKIHPTSSATRLVLKDGVRSSLACPIIANSKPIGIIIFSSFKPLTYKESHIGIFSELAEDLTVVIEHGKLRKFFAENTSKDRLLGMIVHDLRSPASVIYGFLSLIVEEDWYKQLDPTSKNIFTILERNATTILDLLADLSDMNQLASGHFSISQKSVNLKEFLTEIVESTRLIAKRKRIAFKFIHCEHLPSVAKFDPARIKQVLENLISNAIKFSKPGTEIILDVGSSPSRLNFSITDHGPGIPDKELQSLFQHFGKTSVKPTSNEPSTGLGLFIAKNLVDAHGGEISVESEINVGSKFYFWLPSDQE